MNGFPCALNISLLTAAQAAAAGYSQHDTARLLRIGQWSAMRRGIYLPDALPVASRERHLSKAAAALLALRRSDAVLAHRTAAIAWGLDWITAPETDEVWLAQPRARKVRYYPGLRILPAALPEDHLTHTVDGLPITTVARTAVDLARHLSFREGVVVAESALRRGLATQAQLHRVLTDCVGWPFVRRARRVIFLAGSDTESVAESLARAVFDEAGLPAPASQRLILDRAGAVIGRVDFLFAGRLIVEIDGRLKYTDPDVLWREKRREDRLREEGYEVVRLTWADLVGPVSLIRARLLAALSRAAVRSA